MAYRHIIRTVRLVFVLGGHLLFLDRHLAAGHQVNLTIRVPGFVPGTEVVTMDLTDIVRAESIANEDIRSRAQEVMAEAMVQIMALRASFEQFKKIRSRIPGPQLDLNLERLRLIARSSGHV